MAEIMMAHEQWATRPADQRFTSLHALAEFTAAQRAASVGAAISTRRLQARPIMDGAKPRGLAVAFGDAGIALPTHWAFGQLCQRAGAPAGYLRSLPSPLAADCINAGLMMRDVEEVGILARRDGGPAELAAVTGPNYGRVWNSQIAAALVQRFGDGVTGAFRVPGIRGVALEQVTKEDTTIYASDRDMFVFLADEEHRIEVPNRRNGQPGSLARGFFVWNSEVGSATFGVATFLFDFVCQNRIVWGADGYKEIKIRHTSSAPDRWVEEVTPAIERYAHSSTASIDRALKEARAKRLGDGDAVTAFLRTRFTQGQAAAIQAAHVAEEGRPIETLWDAVTGATAYAKGIQWQDERVDLERKAGAILTLATA